MVKTRYLWMDLLNIFSCIAVVMLHHNGIVHNYNVYTSAWKEALVFEVIFFWAVPVFFMLSGANLLKYREYYSTKTFMCRRFTRTVIPFLVWSFLGILVGCIIGRIPFDNIAYIISMIINTRILQVYWFFIPLFSLYLATPVLSILVIPQYKSILRYFIFWSFVTYSILPLIFLLFHIDFNNALLFPLNGGGYVMFFLLGYYLNNYSISKKQRYYIYVLGIISMFFRYFGTLILSIESGEIVRTFFSYTQIHSVLLAVAVFVFFKNTDFTRITRMFSTKYIEKISSCSLGVYFIHKIIMRGELLVFHIHEDNGIWRFIGAFITYFVCLVIILGIKKIPIVKRIVS